MEELILPGELRAFVYLAGKGDVKNQCQLTENALIVIRKGKRETFDLRYISSVVLQNKKMLFPLIAGGILTPFSLLIHIANYFDPTILLIGFLTGMVFFYIGWNGQHVMTVHYNKMAFNFPLPFVSNNLKAFVEYFHEATEKGDQIRSWFYVVVDKRERHLILDENDTLAKEKGFWPLKMYTYRQLIETKPEIDFDHMCLVSVDPASSGTEITFETDANTGRMHPILKRGVRKEAVDFYDAQQSKRIFLANKLQ